MDDLQSILLVSDLDDTLLGDRAALSRFAAWFKSHREHFRLAYASGRLYDSVVASVHSTALPAPDVIAGGVGTELNHYPSGDPIDEWEEQITNAWSPRTVLAVLDGFPGLVLQPERFLTDTKISYYLDDATEADLDEIRRRLRDAGIAADVIYSSNRDLDVLPEGVSKGAAASFLADLWDFDPEQVVVAGDSGNDLSMFEQGFRGIVVANAHPEVKAQDDEANFHSIHERADGVLDGMAHYLDNRIGDAESRAGGTAAGHS
jgi:sucrose phosphatase-like protein